MSRYCSFQEDIARCLFVFIFFREAESLSSRLSLGFFRVDTLLFRWRYVQR
jgi:hypothetical protein